MIHLQLQESDLLAAQRLHLRPEGWRKLICLAVVIVPAAVVVWAVWRYLDERHGSRILLLVVLGVVGLSIGGVLGYLFVDLPRTTRRTFRQQRSLRDPMDLTWDERGITFTAPTGYGTVAWEDYVKWKENDRLVLMYQSDRLFNIIPKTAFASPEDERDFRRYLPRVGANLR